MNEPVEELWDDIRRSSETLPPAPAEIELLDERLNRPASSPRVRAPVAFEDTGLLVDPCHV